jgi:hypothetical protein
VKLAHETSRIDLISFTASDNRDILTNNEISKSIEIRRISKYSVATVIMLKLCVCHVSDVMVLASINIIL